MRLSNRNKQSIWYATFISKTPILDEYENDTGQSLITYSEPVKATWNIGYVESDSEVAMFGISASSTLRIVAPKDGFPLAEGGILWFGKEPETSYVATSPKNNYIVAGIRPSLNELVFYARKVDVS